MRRNTKIALITGGNSGIGRASAKRFVEEDAQVIITGRHQKTPDETGAKLGPDKVTAFKADSAQPAETKKVLDAVKEKHGRLDVLFLNAGIAPMTPLESATGSSHACGPIRLGGRDRRLRGVSRQRRIKLCVERRLRRGWRICPALKYQSTRHNAQTTH